MKEIHETLYHFQKPRDEIEANAWLQNFLIRYNAMDHRSEPHSRTEDWLQNLPAGGIRAMCSWERFCTFAREPDRRKVAIDARVTVDGTPYEVDSELAGEDVVLWWGLFDQELFVEHGEKRFGPYLPVGGPIPLNRYRAFKKSSAQRRADRIELFETTQLQQVVTELKLAIKDSKLIVLAGMVGTGKTTMLQQIPDLLEQDKAILIANSLVLDVSQVTPATLVQTLFSELAIDKDDPMPKVVGLRERALRDLIRKRKKPVALFIDDAHQLSSKTLIALKRLMEIVRSGKGTLSIVLARYPKLKNDLLRASMEEIGARTTFFELNGFGHDKKKYLYWLLEQVTAAETKLDTLITEAAVTLLCEKLTTPLQFELYLTRAFVEAFRVGQKPVDADTIKDILAPDLEGLEARMTRNGYNIKLLTDILTAKPKEIRSFLNGQLPPERTQELHDQLLAAGVLL